MYKGRANQAQGHTNSAACFIPGIPQLFGAHGDNDILAGDHGCLGIQPVDISLGIPGAMPLCIALGGRLQRTRCRHGIGLRSIDHGPSSPWGQGRFFVCALPWNTQPSPSPDLTRIQVPCNSRTESFSAKSTVATTVESGPGSARKGVS